MSHPAGSILVWVMKLIPLVADRHCSAFHGMTLLLQQCKMTVQSRTKSVLHRYLALIEFGTVYRALGKTTTTKRRILYGVGLQQLQRKVKTMRWHLTISVSSQTMQITKQISLSAVLV